MGANRWAMWLGAIVVLAGAGGCQPLYGGRPERLITPHHRRRPPGANKPAVKVKYIETCHVSFSGDPKRVHPQLRVAGELDAAGDAAMQNADAQKGDDAKKVQFIEDAIDKYRNALIKNPYDIDATLKLAVAYDAVLRKGCAIALLKRLAALSNNPKYADKANRNIDSIDENGDWFKGYRKDAMAAVGR